MYHIRIEAPIAAQIERDAQARLRRRTRGQHRFDPELERVRARVREVGLRTVNQSLALAPPATAAQRSMATSTVRPGLVDRLIELYCDWREESASVRTAYARFSSAARPERSLRYAAYIAALDREAAACRVYADHVGRIA
jgi:hypothetical protein